MNYLANMILMGSVATSSIVIEDVLNIINATGFPIACVVFLAYYVRELNKSHKEEIDALKTQLSELNLTMQKTVDRIEELIRKVINDEE